MIDSGTKMRYLQGISFLVKLWEPVNVKKRVVRYIDQAPYFSIVFFCFAKSFENIPYAIVIGLEPELIVHNKRIMGVTALWVRFRGCPGDQFGNESTALQ
jgi:hypothetical protein